MTKAVTIVNEYGIWLLGLAVVYTTLLIAAGHVARRKAARGEDFFVGGRQFSPLIVALCITGLFSGSTYIAILELAYLHGVSAVWYGVAETVYLMQVLPAPLVGVFFLGVWACALSWGAPCQFSGATSLGRDVGSALRPRATNEQLIRYTKWSLLLLTGLMIVFGMLRTEQSAWWNILAWTVRNSATFAPVLGALFWPLVTKRGVMISMIGGFSAGLLWYHWGDWSPVQFFLNTHPVWVGMGVNLALMITATLWERRGEWRLAYPNSRLAFFGVTATIVLALVNALAFGTLYAFGLLGLTLFSMLVSLFIALITLTNSSTSIRGEWNHGERTA